MVSMKQLNDINTQHSSDQLSLVRSSKRIELNHRLLEVRLQSVFSQLKVDIGNLQTKSRS